MFSALALCITKINLLCNMAHSIKTEATYPYDTPGSSEDSWEMLTFAQLQDSGLRP